jgi:hypothetical protein
MTLKEIMNLWPLILFFIAILWKQIDNHFKVIELDKSTKKNEEDIRLVEKDLHFAIKEQGTQTNESIKELTKATSALVTATQVMASQLEDLRNSQPTRKKPPTSNERS